MFDKLAALLPTDIDRELWALDRAFLQRGGFGQPCVSEQYERQFRADWYCRHSIRRQCCAECRISPK